MAGMLAMIIGPKGAKQYERETGNKLGNLEEADRMLGDREWKSLTRDEKLAIRKVTGWQIGPGGDWMFETDRDPSLSEGFKRKYGDRYSYRDAEIAKTKKVADEVRRVRDSYRQLVKERGLSGNESYGEEFLPAEVLWDTPETMANHMRIWRGLLKDTMHESDPVKMSFLNDKKLLKAEADLAAHMETSKGRPDFSPYEGTLGDVLDFDRTPELLAAYPGLDKVKLRIEEREDGTLGEWNNETKTLTMTRRALEEKGLQGSLGTLLHELTHRVQDSEGFANGGSYLSTIFNRPSEIYWSFKSPTPENLPKRPDNYFYFGGSNPVVDNPASRVDRVMEQFWNLSSRNADYAERHPDDTAPLHSSHDFRKFIGPAWKGFHKGQYGLPDLTPLPEGNLSDPEVMNAWKEENYAIIRTALDSIMGPIRAYDSAVARAKEAERIEKERQDAINKTILEMQKRYDTSTNAIQDKGLGKYDELYRRIAGETGARNSELRMKMSQEERMGSLLEDTEDRKRAEQIDSRFGFGNAVDPESFDEILREHPRMLQQAAKGGNASGASGVRQAAGGGAAKISYEDLRKLADATYKGDIRAAVYSLGPKVVTATVDSFGGNIDRTNRPMYVHRDKDGKITGYSTTNSGDALDRGVKPEGRFQSVLVPFVRQGKDGPEYTEDYNVAQKWYDESGQHYGKFDMDFTTPEAKARSIDRFNAASWLVHREQQLRYQPEFDKLVEAERRQAAKAGDAGHSKSYGVHSGHNPALDGYTGPRIIVNPEVMHDKRDALCVAYNEAIRIFMETNEYEPQSEPTEKQRRFFADTPYADDELQLRRTILARICVFDTSVKDPTDDQLSESASVLRAIIDSGFAKTDDEIEKCERLARAIEAAVGAEPVKPKEAPLEARPLRPTAETQAAIDAGKTDEEKDLFGRNGTVETTAQDVEDFKSNADKDPFGRNGTVETTAQDVEDFKADAGRAAAQPAAPGQEQPAKQAAVQPRQEQPAQQVAVQPQQEQLVQQVAVQPQQEQLVQQVAVQPQQEQLAPGLARSGSRSNILEFNGRRISQREFDRIQAKFLEGGGAQQPQAARPVQQPQVAANDVDDALKPNKLRQTTQVDSGRKDALGRPLDEYGRVIA